MRAFQTYRGANIHLDAECPARVRSPCKKLPLREIVLENVKSVKYCKTCCPAELWDVPRTFHAICTECGQKKAFPCRHNGGIPVIDVATLKNSDKRRVAVRWRWPEHVRDTPIAQNVIAV